MVILSVKNEVRLYVCAYNSAGQCEFEDRNEEGGVVDTGIWMRFEGMQLIISTSVS